MPGRNGTGPMGAGAGSGRGLGPCVGKNAKAAGYGGRRGPWFVLGPACGCGFGRGFERACPAPAPEAQKELLERQKDVLKVRINAIDHQLENL